MVKEKGTVPYFQLQFVPTIIADEVCQQVYTGQELSRSLRNSAWINTIEQRRLAMTDQQRSIFASLCETRCFDAYERQAEWFEKCVKSKSNRGRDQLYVWVRHWLASYLNNPERFVKQCEGGRDGIKG